MFDKKMKQLEYKLSTKTVTEILHVNYCTFDRDNEKKYDRMPTFLYIDPFSDIETLSTPTLPLRIRIRKRKLRTHLIIHKIHLCPNHVH